MHTSSINRCRQSQSRARSRLSPRQPWPRSMRRPLQKLQGRPRDCNTMLGWHSIAESRASWHDHCSNSCLILHMILWLVLMIATANALKPMKHSTSLNLCRIWGGDCPPAILEKVQSFQGQPRLMSAISFSSRFSYSFMPLHLCFQFLSRTCKWQLIRL